MTQKTLNVIVFPGGFNLPLWAAQEQGFFARENLDVQLHMTASSMEQLSGLIGEKWDLAMTGFDNVVAYQEGQGEAQIDREPDLFVFMGADNAFLRLVVRGDINSYEELRGKTLSVDAMTTGYAFVLRKMIELALHEEGAVNYERAGGVMQRWEALLAGKHAGTLLITPFEIIAEKVGLRLLQNASDVIPSYQGVVGATRRSWAAQNGEALTGYIRAFMSALDWLYDRSNRDAACKLLMSKVPNMQQPVAERTYDTLFADEGGFARKAEIDWRGVDQVLALRSEYGRPQKTLTDPKKYFDLTWYEKALSR